MDAIGEDGGVRRRQGMKEEKGDGERGGREERKKSPEERRRKEKWKGLGDRSREIDESNIRRGEKETRYERTKGGW